MVLEEENVPFELVKVEISKGQQKDPEYMKKHPFGKVPVLEVVEDGFSVFESHAIAVFVSQLSERNAMFPSDIRKHALINQWISAAASYAKPAIGKIYFEKVLKVRYGKGPTDDSVVADELPKAREFLGILETALSKSEYFAGENFSLADIFFTPEIYNLEQSGLAHIVSEFPHLAKWYEAATSRASWKRALEYSA